MKGALKIACMIMLFILNISCNMPEKPNIIIILADDLGYGDLGCYGAEQISTPNCDRIAAEGMMFTDAHSPSAVCTPTRYGLLTGRYCWRSWLKNWVLWENMPLLIDTTRVTVASMLREQGYRTGCVGKWHLGWGTEIDHSWEGDVIPGPLEVGFDYYYGVPHSHNSPPFLQVFMENRSILGLEEGDNLFDEKIIKKIQRRLDETAISLSAEAVSFIKKNKKSPFFLYYATTNIHVPITPNERFKGVSIAGPYGDFVAEFDWAVGEILDVLDRNDLTEQTLIFVTSDNGGTSEAVSYGHRSNGSWKGYKCQIYEGGHRVPFIARWPGKIEPGTTSNQLVCLTDFMSTLAALSGYDLQAASAEDSYNFLPVLLDEKTEKPLREAIIHHSISGMFAIRQGKWKLIDGIGDGDPGITEETDASAENMPERDLATGEFKDLVYYFPPVMPASGEPAGQLYDLENDPGETANLWNEHPEIVERLQEILIKSKNEGRTR